MYEYITGKIVDTTPKYITIDNSGIGYNIKTPNPYSYEINSIATIYLYLHLREDLIELYGFPSKQERDFFLSLISVKGIGPKAGLSILASGKLEETLNAIKESNTKYLEKFPGIGAKASQQIVLDLKGKINFNEESINLVDPRLIEIREHLINLGYKNQEIKRIEPTIIENIDKPMSELIKISLKAMLKF